MSTNGDAALDAARSAKRQPQHAASGAPGSASGEEALVIDPRLAAALKEIAQDDPERQSKSKALMAQWRAKDGAPTDGLAPY